MFLALAAIFSTAGRRTKIDCHDNNQDIFGVPGLDTGGVAAPPTGV